MSEQSAIAYAERIKNDSEFRLSLAAAPDREARRAVAQEAGYDVGAEDVPAIKAALGFSEISDEDLERVAGGTGGASGSEFHVHWTLLDTFGSTFAFAHLL